LVSLTRTFERENIFLETVGSRALTWKCRGKNSEGFKALGLVTLNNAGFRIYVRHISKLKKILLLKKLTVFLMSSLCISVGNIHSLLIPAPGWRYFTSSLFKKRLWCWNKW